MLVFHLFSVRIKSFFFFISAELKMDVLREREFKDSLERQLTEERKLRGKLKIDFIYFYFVRTKILTTIPPKMFLNKLIN